MRHIQYKKYMLAMRILFSSLLPAAIQRTFRNIKALLRATAHIVRQPGAQYRMALLLATLLAFLLGWRLFVSTFTYTASLAFSRQL